jgi:hypothetical protein
LDLRSPSRHRALILNVSHEPIRLPMPNSAYFLISGINKQSRPAINGASVVGKAFKKVQQSRMTPIAVARESHHLPFGAVYWKRHTSSEATSRI